MKAKSDLLIAPLLYDYDMQSKYQPQVNYNKIEISSDTNIKDVKFMDQIKVQCLILNKCSNFNFRKAPTQLQYLTLNDCNISDLEGLQQFQQLKKVLARVDQEHSNTVSQANLLFSQPPFTNNKQYKAYEPSRY
ncbi:Leucine-rich_repeat domain superfamily [Hexamita inflata]|uniref:Leucine-rich repeat domain superfamily n=1 Tax=Hexamita inflata TaxID=28002 RepID=A0AA86S5Y0_9EUKA|nr:Leucine-rich repeat domain superfamily [Hexamita inflata]